MNIVACGINSKWELKREYNKKGESIVYSDHVDVAQLHQKWGGRMGKDIYAKIVFESFQWMCWHYYCYSKTLLRVMCGKWVIMEFANSIIAGGF